MYFDSHWNSIKMAPCKLVGLQVGIGNPGLDCYDYNPIATTFLASITIHEVCCGKRSRVFCCQFQTCTSFLKMRANEVETSVYCVLK